VVCPGETRVDPAEPGDVEVAVVQLGHRTGHGDLGQPVDLWIGGARERDPGPVANLAVRAVAAHQVAGGHLVGPVRAAHSRRHGSVVLADADYLVSAADAGAEFAGVLAEQALEPRLGEMHHPYRGIRQLREVQLQAAKRGAASRADGTAAGRFDPVQQAPVAQQFHDLPVETAGLRGLPRSGLPFQY
jgi:hypothetical protein